MRQRTFLGPLPLPLSRFLPCLPSLSPLSLFLFLLYSQKEVFLGCVSACCQHDLPACHHICLSELVCYQQAPHNPDVFTSHPAGLHLVLGVWATSAKPPGILSSVLRVFSETCSPPSLSPPPHTYTCVPVSESNLSQGGFLQIDIPQPLSIMLPNIQQQEVFVWGLAAWGRESRKYQRIWQNGAQNRETHTSPRSSLYLTRGSLFSFLSPDSYLIAQITVIARKEMKG